MAYDLRETPEKESVERITLGHYADQLNGGIARLHGLLDKLDGGVPAMASEVKSQSLTHDLDAARLDLEQACQRLAEIVERIGRIL